MTPTPKNFKRYKYPYKRIYIKWDDACSNNAKWMYPEQVDNWMKDNSQWIAEELGFLVAEDDSALFTVSAVIPEGADDEEMVRHIHRIPRNWILKKKVLK